MCGRYTSRTPVDDVADHFSVDEVVAPDLGPRYNVAPTDDVYAVATVGERRRLGALRWGLVPWWADDPRIGSRMINARAETVASKPAFRRLLAGRRCIVPADGFYEWRKADGARAKQAFHIRRGDGGLLGFAGLWDTWRPKDDRDADPLTSCTIVTTDAGPRLADVHPRMPVVLPPERWDRWLDPEVEDVDELQALLRPVDHDLVLVPVSSAVNDVRNDGPALVEPVTGAEAPPAGSTRNPS